MKYQSVPCALFNTYTLLLYRISLSKKKVVMENIL